MPKQIAIAMLTLCSFTFLVSACSGGSGLRSDEDDLTSCAGTHLDSNGKCRTAGGRFAKKSCCVVTEPEPKVCGGAGAAACGDDEYCEYPPGKCGADDVTGTCRARPTICPLFCPAAAFRPCGCDGQAYCNECEAAKAGVDVSSSFGTCGGVKTCGGSLGEECGEAEYCDYGTDGQCGMSGAMGTCQPRPTSCPIGCPPPEYQVCGCDGQTYCSECDAQKAGVALSVETGSCVGSPGPGR